MVTRTSASETDNNMEIVKAIKVEEAVATGNVTIEAAEIVTTVIIRFHINGNCIISIVKFISLVAPHSN